MRVARWARSYCAVVVLNIALVGELPSRPDRPGIGIERVYAPDGDRLDPRERIGRTIITVPLDLAGRSRSAYDLN